MIETIIAIAGSILGWLTYKKTFLDRPKEEINHLILFFKATQRLSLKVRNDLARYAEEKNAYNQELFTGVSVETYIIMLKESFEKNLSDDLLDQVIKLNMPKLTIISMTQSLEKQFNELTQLESIIQSRMIM